MKITPDTTPQKIWDYHFEFLEPFDQMVASGEIVYVMNMVETVAVRNSSTKSRAPRSSPTTSCGVSAIDGLESWLLEHCGERGTGWDLRGGLIGIRDPDAAFWFRCSRWM